MTAVYSPLASRTEFRDFLGNVISTFRYADRFWIMPDDLDRVMPLANGYRAEVRGYLELRFRDEARMDWWLPVFPEGLEALR
jgi:hypothetical protein